MQVTILALERDVSRRVAVHAAWVHEDRVRREKCCASTGIILLAHCLSDVDIHDARAGTIRCPFALIHRNHQEQHTNNYYPLHGSPHPVLPMDDTASHNDPPS